MKWLVPIVFGWPAAHASIALSSVGLVLRRPVVVWLGAFVGLPFMFYVFLTPRFRALALLAAFCHFAAAVMLRRSALSAWLLFIPTPLVTWYFAAAIAAG